MADETHNQKRALVVDDKSGVLDLVSTLLKCDKGYDVVDTSRSHGKAVDFIRGGRYDLYWLDWNYFRTEGSGSAEPLAPETITEIRKVHPDAKIVLFCSDRAAPAYARENNIPFLQKPADIKDMTALM